MKRGKVKLYKYHELETFGIEHGYNHLPDLSEQDLKDLYHLIGEELEKEKDKLLTDNINEKTRATVEIYLEPKKEEKWKNIIPNDTEYEAVRIGDAFVEIQVNLDFKKEEKKPCFGCSSMNYGYKCSEKECVHSCEHKCDFHEPSKKTSITIGCMECGNNIKL